MDCCWGGGDWGDARCGGGGNLGAFGRHGCLLSAWRDEGGRKEGNENWLEKGEEKRGFCCLLDRSELEQAV